METVQVSARVPAKEEGGQDLSAEIGVQFPSTFEEAKTYLGPQAEETILTNARANWVITLQANIRNGLKRGETQDQIQGRLGTSKPGIASAGVRVDPVQAFTALFASATPERKAELLAELQAKASGQAAAPAVKAAPAKK
jgi:hypothetical protein